MRQKDLWRCFMKFIKRLSLLSTTFLISAGIIPTEDILFFAQTDAIYGPFNNEGNHTVGFIAPVNGRETYSMTIDYYYESTGNKYGTQTFMMGKTDYNYQELLTSGYFSNVISSGIKIKYIFEGKMLKTRPVTSILRMPGEDQFIAKGKKVFPYVCWGIVNGVAVNEESYDFEDMNEYFSVSNDNAFDLSEIRFLYYPNNTSLLYKKAYLEITDYEHIYRYMSITMGSVIKVPVVINQNNNEISFEIKSNMYVNQKNLQMSSIPGLGFVKTDNFYLPLEGKDKIQNNEMRIVIEEAGFNKSKISIPVQYFNTHGYFGMCADSEYCIGGGIKE